ncbi:MAG: cardiolipin synthase [Chloroflexales bacterium]|nr:cardiolipin synthase [Chloroflexales bacterium]
MQTIWTFVGAILVLISWLIGIVMLFIVPVNRKPSAATAWLLLIFLAPYLGLAIFLLIGSPKLNTQRRAFQRKMDELIAQAVAIGNEQPELRPIVAPPIESRYEPFAKLNTQLGGMPAFAGNAVELIHVYDDIIHCIADDIDRAQHFVHIAFYIIALDKTTECVFAAMERAVQRGVAVRVMLDQIGSRRYPHRETMLKRMTDMGIEWRYMLPVRFFSNEWNRLDLRNHRKIVAVDNRIGYTGSLNLIDRTYHRKDELYYDELVVRVTGPVVAQLNAVFITDWFSETGELLAPANSKARELAPMTGDVMCQVLPSGSGHDNENNLRLFTALIHAAQRSLMVVNPYFVPDDALLLAITSAAQRGVDVIMLNSEAPDQFMVYHAQRSYYEELLRAGVKIRLYRRPILLHSKFMVIDDDIAMIGSSNLDMRSFQLNLEVSLAVYDKPTAQQLRQIADEYLQRSVAIELEAWQQRSLSIVLFDNIARLTAALQ